MFNYILLKKSFATLVNSIILQMLKFDYLKKVPKKISLSPIKNIIKKPLFDKTHGIKTLLFNLQTFFTKKAELNVRCLINTDNMQAVF